MLALAGLLLVWWGLRPAATRWRRLATATSALALGVVAVRNGVTFYHVWGHGQIRPWVPFPLSFVLAAALFYVAWVAARRTPAPRGRLAPLRVAAIVVLCGILFPLAQQIFFGKTDYVRPAQTAVVFGAEVHGDGRPSVSLRDRVRTAAQLYEAGLTQHLLMSGGQGPGEPVNETTVMRNLAIGFGVPAAAIAVDPRGVNTDATVRDTVPLPARRRLPAGRRRERLLSPAARQARLSEARLRRHHRALESAPHSADDQAGPARDPGLLGVLPA